MNRYSRYFCAMALGAALISCGGGGGSAESSVPPLKWQDAQFLESVAEQTFDEDVAIGSDGNGVAVWTQIVGNKRRVFASLYRNGAWEPSVPVSDEVEGTVANPQAVVLPDGDALAIWSQGISGEDQSVVFKRSVNGAWSGNETFVLGGLDEVKMREMVADANGTAVAVWEQVRNDGDISVINSAVFRQGVLTKTQILSAGSAAKDADVAIDADGNALVVWMERHPTSNIDAVRVRALVGDAWKPERVLKPVESAPGVPQGARDPRVALGGDGRALVATANVANTRVEVRRAIDFRTNNWLDEVIPFGASPSAHLGPVLALDPQGNATLVWLEDDGDIANVVSARLMNNSGGAVTQNFVRIETGPAYADSPQVGVDGSGRAVAVWSQENATGSYDMWSNRFDPLSGTWGTSELIEKDDVGSVAGFPSLAVNASGRALAVWVQGIFSPSGIHQDMMGNALR